jgi:hypothetical protein
MKPKILILSPDPHVPSFEGRWQDVFDLTSDLLQSHGLEVSHCPWTDENYPEADLTLPLLTWGYHNHPEAFVKTMDRLHDQSRWMKNEASVIIWNHNKLYLRDLAQMGISTIPTLFSHTINEQELRRARDDFGVQSLILKPVISAGAKQTFVWDHDHCPDHPPKGLCMIQPLMKFIHDEGEWSLLVFGGAFSHAVLKTPKDGDFRSQPDYGAYLRPLEPPPEALDLLNQILDFVGRDRLLYARADMVRKQGGGFALMELELIEPDLYLQHAPDQGSAFALAVKAACQREIMA